MQLWTLEQIEDEKWQPQAAESVSCVAIEAIESWKEKVFLESSQSVKCALQNELEFEVKWEIEMPYLDSFHFGFACFSFLFCVGWCKTTSVR